MSKDMEFSRIVIYSTTALGDFMFNTPAIKAVRKRYPDAHITLISSKKNSGLVEDCELFDAVIYWDNKVKDIFSVVFPLRKMRPQLAIILHSLEPYDILSAVLSGCEYIIRDNYVDDMQGLERWLSGYLTGYQGHLIQRKLDLLACLGCDNTDTEMMLPLTIPPPVANSEVRIGFQMGASERLRCWPVAHFVSLAKMLIEYDSNYKIVLIGTEKEKKLESEFFSLMGEMGGDNVESYIGKTSLLDLLNVINNMDVMISGDTGPLHLAVVLKRPTISLFATANPKSTGPYQNMELHDVIKINDNDWVNFEASPLSAVKPEPVYEKIITRVSQH